MHNFTSVLMKTEDAKYIQREYKFLLSFGFSNCEAEKEIISFFTSRVTVREQGMFWILFALVQWNLGRLSRDVYAEAVQWIQSSSMKLPSDSAAEIMKTLDSPMPEQKKITKPQRIKCPWEKGALLAYRISTCEDIKDSHFWNKYVLLRVVEIKKWPVSAIIPELAYDESMYVALYDWVGESIPTNEIIQELEYTPISFRKPLIAQLHNKTQLEQCANIIGDSQRNIVFDAEYTNFIYALDWRGRKTSAVFTPIVQSGSQEKVSTLINQNNLSTRIPPMAGLEGFDIILLKRMNELFPQGD